jgi:uncharacterized protein YggE
MMRLPETAAWLAISVTLAGFASAQTIQINRDNKTIAISATDEAAATSDIAAITIGFEVYGPDSQSAYAQGGDLSNAILEALHKAGVKDDSIESAAQGLLRNTEFSEKDTLETRAKRQFVFRQSWVVSVSPQVAAEVIRVAVAGGANMSGEIDWRLSNRKALQAKAAENALVKAREVATKMADGLHVKLGALIYASNQIPEATLFGERRPAAEFGVAGMESLEAPVPKRLEIFPKTIREEATVYAVFAIE